MSINIVQRYFIFMKKFEYKRILKIFINLKYVLVVMEKFLLRVICMFFVFLLSFSKIEIKPKTGEAYPIITNDGTWCWFTEPRAFYFKGKYERIYLGWIDHKGNIVVGYCNIKDKNTGFKIVHKNFEIDDHDHPAVYVDGNGFVHLYYSYHATSKPIFYRKSKFPENINDWEGPFLLYINDTINYKGYRNSYTYANIVTLKKENNRQYLFWRGMDFKPNVAIKDSIWSLGKILILPERIYKDRRPYLRIFSDEIDKIHFAFTDGHPRDEKYNSIYYMYYQSGNLYRANGSIIFQWKDIPVIPINTDIVYDAHKTGEKAWVWDVAQDKNGNPIIVYSRFPNDSTHLYYYAKWDGKQWNNYFMVNSGKWFPQTPQGKVEREPNYSGGMVIDYNNPEIVFISIQRKGIFEIERWKFDDKKILWSITPITNNSKNHNVRPVVARNNPYRNTTFLFWLNVEKYAHYTDYKTSIRYTTIVEN